MERAPGPLSRTLLLRICSIAGCQTSYIYASILPGVLASIQVQDFGANNKQWSLAALEINRVLSVNTVWHTNVVAHLRASCNAQFTTDKLRLTQSNPMTHIQHALVSPFNLGGFSVAGCLNILSSEWAIEYSAG